MIRYFVQHPTASNLIMAAIIILGLVAVPQLQRETFPEIPPEHVEVRVLYPGATPETMEEAICYRVEKALDGVKDQEEVTCQAQEGIAILVMKMREGGDYDELFDDVKIAVEGITTFPDEVEKPIVRPLGRLDFVASVAIAAPMTPPDLKAYAEAVKRRMMRETPISQVEIKGFSDHQIRIEIPARTLRRFNLSTQKVAERIAQQSLDMPAGTIEARSQEILLRFTEERRSLQAFQDLIIVAGTQGAEIRLGDIAQISDRFEQEENQILFNGQRAAVLEVSKTRDQDTLVVMDHLNAFLAQERETASPSVLYTVTKDLSSAVRDRLNMLLHNGLQGLVLVFLAMWLFFSFRFAFWVSAGLPVAFMGAIFLMHGSGYGLNMISMVALLIAIGLMMDDAIVIAENVAAKRVAGLSVVESAVVGVQQVFPGIVSSFLTTVCLFGSLAFVTGHLGMVLRVLPIILIFTLDVQVFGGLTKREMAAVSVRQTPNRAQQGFSTSKNWPAAEK